MENIKIIKVKNREFLKKLPETPGVYLFLNKKKEIVYVGRAASLRSRVSSYFVRSRTPHTRPARHASQLAGVAGRPIEQLISEVISISYEKTSNLLEAAVLESNLIKRHMPKYNVRNKDNRSFVYLYFDKTAEFPRPIIIRGRELEKHKPNKGEILGPYQSYHFLKNLLLVARRVYPYSTCIPNQGKPCFHNQIGLCPGMCIGAISSEDYKKKVDKLIRFLKSSYPKSAKKKINDIALMPEEFSVPFATNDESRIEGYDISHFQKDVSYGAMAVFENNEPISANYRLFEIKQAKIGDDIAAFKEVLERRFKHTEWSYPNLIIVDGGRQQVNAAISVLKKSGLNIPVLGLAKGGRHSQSASSMDVLTFPKSIKKTLREILSSQKKLFQKIRNEAHRFSLNALRRSRNFSLTKKKKDSGKC